MSSAEVRIPVESCSVTELTKETCCCRFGPVEIWGDGIEVEVFLPVSIGTEEEIRAAALAAVPWIEEQLALIQAHKSEIALEMQGDKERAEEWIWDDPDFVELSDNEGYTVLDGEKVSVPISDETFRNSLFLWSVVFEPAAAAGLFKMTLEIGCKPDYFAGHRIHVEIDEYRQVIGHGI
jgi:hypothetical protein